MTLSTLLGACGGVREVMFSEVSPDGSHTAYVVRVNSGGATVGFEYEVVVAFSEGDFDPYTERKWLWRSYRMPPTEISWEGPQSVRVQVVADAHYEDMIQTREVEGIRAATAILPTGANSPEAAAPAAESS